MAQTHTIDIEPKWKTLCEMVERGVLKADILMPACEMADLVRQAQKKGKKQVIFTFLYDGKVNVEEVD